VANEHPGRVTDVELESKGLRYVYEVGVVDDSGIRTEFRLDARSGETLSSKIDDDDEDDNDSDDDDDD
jgi:uncharacterized membrane protein YkoI